ncbi:DUF4401 domain-containing protein [Bizionia gelidisalsuginis]|uniref:DUF4401 domain-containing protein n=1 Tax=Bizionia gelidisalsuginis TaxID=291188 RepID=A0ABY3MEY1_9FLAO|nr:DUF4401 domain-containing protein [Bizionia gelidisalsuginis]TYC18101.1 DUF4401 domain-containing protein [Bizionia gelidisalsuginis]
MDKLAHKKVLLDTIRLSEGATFECNEEAILEEYTQKVENTSSVAIKVLSVFGGLFASLFFIGFLAITGLYNSEIGLLIFGASFIIAATAINKAVSKLIIDTISFSMYAIGFILLAFGLYGMDLGYNFIVVLFIIIAFSALYVTQNYMFSFISILIISGGFLALIVLNDVYTVVHLYIAMCTLLLTYVFLNEAKIIVSSKKLSKLYNPLKTALIFSLLFGFITLGETILTTESVQMLWLSSVAIIAIILYLISIIIKINEIAEAKTKIIIYILSALILSSTLFLPAISGTLLIILLSVLVNYKTGLAIGIIAFIYFTIQYYYDLHFTLLIKSILLMSSGMVFILLYLFTSKQLNSNEKI